MTRPITPHKGGRTCRAPDARMTPQERGRLDAVLQRRGVKYINWFIGHVEADYAEINQGDDTMNATYSDIEDCLYRLTGPDVTYQTSLSVSALRRAISTVIEREVSAAVAAESEACAKLADERDLHINEHAEGEHNRIERAKDRIARSIAAAIRARGNGSAAEPPALFDDKISDEEADMLDAEQEEEAAEFLGIKPAKSKRSKRTSK